MKKREFFRNAAILTVTSLALRTIGIFFRIYISNRVGAEGMGLYQMIFSIYILVSSFASAGLNTAVTRLCTDEFACGSARGAKKILYRSMTLSVCVGCASAIIVIFGADTIATHVLHDARAVSALKILTIGLPFMGISSCIKGYFLARRKVTSSSVSQILEQLVRIPAVLWILNAMNSPGVEGACFAILMSDAIAETVSCLYMGASYLLDRRHLIDTRKNVVTHRRMYSLLRIAFPITAGRYLSSGLRTVENVLIPDGLTTFGGTRDIALSQFGKLKGMALPLLFFPSSFLNAFSALLIPELSESNLLSQRRRTERTVHKTMQLTILSSTLIGGLFFVLSEPLGSMIYQDIEVGHILHVLSPLAPIMYLESVTVGLLKGLDQQSHSLLYSVLDSGSRILLILFLLPVHGMNGLYAVMVVSNILTCTLNVHRLCRVSHVRIAWKHWIVYPSSAMTLSVCVVKILRHANAFRALDTSAYCLTVAVMVTAIYGMLIYLGGCFKKSHFAFVKPLRHNENKKRSR